jgi:hypothetical protein
MSRPDDASLHELNSDTCDVSPTHNNCRKAEPGGSPAQSQRPRRSTNRPACGRSRPYGRRHRTTHVWTRISSTIPFYGWFGTETRLSLALACPRISRRRPPRGLGTGDLARAAVCAARVGVRAQPSTSSNRRPCLLVGRGFIDKNQGSPPLLLGPSCLGCSLPAGRSDPIITAAVAV